MFLKMKKYTIILKILYYLKLYTIVFYFAAILWYIRNKVPKKITTKDILELFYYNFLNVPTEDCIIIKMTDDELITRCKNNCPILNFSLNFNIDTKQSCKKISEGPCKFFLKKLDKNIKFIRNYNHIRPYEDGCEEIITINKKSS